MRVLGVLGGKDMPARQLAAWARSAELIVAADGGADTLLAAGCMPHVLLGDLDSASDEARAAVPEVLSVPDQDSTDCDKLLRLLESRGHDDVTLAGVEGDLPDHVLASLQSAAKSELRVRIAFRQGLGIIVKEREAIEVKADVRVSVVPISRCEGVHLSGVQWPLDDAVLDPLGLTSVSNRSIGGQVELSLRSGAALLFVQVPEDELPTW